LDDFSYVGNQYLGNQFRAPINRPMPGMGGQPISYVRRDLPHSQPYGQPTMYGNPQAVHMAQGPPPPMHNDTENIESPFSPLFAQPKPTQPPSGYPPYGGYMGNQQSVNQQGIPPSPFATTQNTGAPSMGFPSRPGFSSGVPTHNPNIPGRQYSPAEAEKIVRTILYNASQMKGLDRQETLNYLRTQIGHSPELLEALRVIKERTAMMNRAHPGQPGPQAPPQPQMVNGPMGNTMNHPYQSNSVYPASLRVAMPGQYQQPPPPTYIPPPVMSTPSGNYHNQDSHYSNMQQPKYGVPGSQPNNSYNNPPGSFYPPPPAAAPVPPPPIAKPKMTTDLAQSLLQQTANPSFLTDSSQNTPTPSTVVSSDTVPTLDQEIDSSLTGTDRTIEIIMKKCEEISKRLRDSLQKNFKFLETKVRKIFFIFYKIFNYSNNIFIYFFLLQKLGSNNR
jgi:hypothetical protein